MFEDKRLISSQGNQGHVEKIYKYIYLFCLVLVSKILLFLFPACAASSELDSKLFRLSKNLTQDAFNRFIVFFFFSSVRVTWDFYPISNTRKSLLSVRFLPFTPS